MSIARNVASIADAAAAYIGRAIADMEWRAEQDRAIREAEHRAALAELAAERAAVESLRQALSDRLATLKDGKDGADGRDGNDADPEVIRSMVEEAVSQIPVVNGKDGRDGTDGKDGRDGADGKDADPEVIRSMIAEAVAKIPTPKDGRDGADGKDGADGVSVTRDDVAPMISEMIAEAVAAIPVPKDGKDGRDGADGKDGERGEPGPIGALPEVKAWEDRVYYQGNVVTHDGALWQAIRDTGKQPGSEDWLCLVRAGQDGKDGRSFRHVGTYDADGAYSALDVVNLNGGAFVAKADNPGPCPGEGWSLLAMQGKQGKPGPKGDKGDTGLRGLPARNVVEISVDGEGMLTLVNADGSTVQCDLYPLLSKVR